MDIPVTRKARRIVPRRLKTVVVLIGLVLSAVVAASIFNPAVPSISQADVWVSEVRKGPFTRKVRGVGILVPQEIRWVAAVSSGRVERLLIKPGALVTTSTVIAELSNADLRTQLEQAQWELDAAEANLLALEAQLQEQKLEQDLQVTQARMALESAQLREKAEQPLADKNIISELDFATTQLTTKQREAELAIRLKTQLRRIDVEEAKLMAEKAKVRKFRNMVSHYQTQIDGLRITADIEGVLQQISVDVGQQVQAGGNIARVARPDSLLAELQVQENMVSDLQLGMPTTIDTRNGLVDGVVIRIDPRVSNGNVQVDIELTGELPQGARPDLSVTGSIVVEHINDTLFIDRPAGAAAGAETQLFTFTDAGANAELRHIKLGKASISSIQVIAGLQQGESVIVSDMSDYDQHPTVRIKN